jgi:hypothetical protein
MSQRIGKLHAAHPRQAVKTCFTEVFSCSKHRFEQHS